MSKLLRKFIEGVGSILDLGGSPDPELQRILKASREMSVGEALSRDGAAVALDGRRAWAKVKSRR